jgi:hypothetical protein
LQYLSKLLDGATKLNVSDLLNRLSQTFPELKMLAKTVNDAKALGVSFEKACQQIYKEYQQVLGQINGIIGVLDGTNFNSAVSLSNMVNSLTGNGLNVILYIPENYFGGNDVYDKIVYTAMTRTRQNLIVINSNKRYWEFGVELPNTWK